jgi:hypothetical protein
MRLSPWTLRRSVLCGVSTLVALVPSCVDDTQVAGVFADPFVDQLIQARTFIDGTAVTTVTHYVGTDRTPFGIDFNADGKIDPVVAYGGQQAVIEILLSQGAAGTVSYLPLTLDSKRDMADLSDVAVGDIDGDNRLDIVAAANGAVWYFRQPDQGPTYLRGWGNPDENDSLRERLAASQSSLSTDDLQAMVHQAIGVLVSVDDYIVTVTSKFTDVEIADFNNDGWNDIAASRSFHLHLEPRPDTGLEAIDVYDGDVSIFVNPGGAVDGRDWQAISVGLHERQLRLDRDGATALVAYDLDGDGDLDLVSAAQNDNNVQVAWFENPLGSGTILSPDAPWTQWRIGSIRSAYAIDVDDLTGDGRADVVATGPDQKQVMLFAQPSTGPKREYDWASSVVATFENYEPRDVRIIDIDGDSAPEIVVGCSGGAVRYFERPSDPSQTWTPFVVANLDPPGTIGLMGFGDLDADHDTDLVLVVSSADDPNAASVSWVRNDLAN